MYYLLVRALSLGLMAEEESSSPVSRPRQLRLAEVRLERREVHTAFAEREERRLPLHVGLHVGLHVRPVHSLFGAAAVFGLGVFEMKLNDRVPVVFCQLHRAGTGQVHVAGIENEVDVGLF